MDALHTLKNSYIKERSAILSRSHLTPRGFFLRFCNAEKYWDELTSEENHLLDSGVRTLAGIVEQQPETANKLKTYQWVLKNLNSKFTERGNFLLALVTLITAFGFTKTTDKFGWTKIYNSEVESTSYNSLMLLVIAGLAIVFAVRDTLRIRSRAAIHEELINVIERYLQGAPAAVNSATPEQVNASTGVESRFFEAIFKPQTYSNLFKAGTVMIGIALVGMSQTSLTLYDKELDAYASKFKIEAVTHRPLQQTDCRFLETLEADCLMAQHKIQTSESALGLLQTVVNIALYGSSCFFVAAIFVFGCTPFVRQTVAKTSTD